MSTSPSRRDLFRSALILGGGAAATLLTAGTASALCTTVREEGLWRNATPKPRAIRNVRLRFVCRDTGGSEPWWYITVFGMCTPRDCEWGEAPMRREGGDLVATYDHRFATRTLRVRLMPSGLLSVRMHTNFRDGRRDYDTNEIFRKVA